MTAFIACRTRLCDQIAKMTRIRPTTTFEAKGRDPALVSRQIDWLRDGIFAAAAARLHAGRRR